MENFWEFIRSPMLYMRLFVMIGWIVFAVFMVRFIFFQPYDSTDDHVKKERSGMQLYIDHGTGCHYLGTGFFGGLTPRLDQDGKQICIGSE